MSPTGADLRARIDILLGAYHDEMPSRDEVEDQIASAIAAYITTGLGGLAPSTGANVLEFRADPAIPVLETIMSQGQGVNIKRG